MVQILSGIPNDMNPKKNTIYPDRLTQHIDFASAELLGSRETQEDYSRLRIFNSGRELLAVLADGMGGHTGGEIASKKAVDSFDATFNTSNSVSVPVKLGAALQQANNDLAVAIQSSPALAGMGCTLVGMHIGTQGLQWISVGDSPLFLFRKKQLSRLNADHSMAPLIKESLLAGRITKEEADIHPNLHALRSSVMGSEIDLIDTPLKPVSLQKGDILILASDGLLTLTEKEIVLILKGASGANAENLAKALISAVDKKKKPRQDNTNLQVVIVPSFLGTSSAIQQYFWWSLALLGIALSVAFAFNWLRIVDTIQPSQQESSKAHLEPKPIPIKEEQTAPSPPTDKQPLQPNQVVNTLPQEGKQDSSLKAAPRAPESFEKAADISPDSKVEHFEKSNLPADNSSKPGGDNSNKNPIDDHSNKKRSPDGAISYLLRGEIWNALATLFVSSK